MSLEAFGDGDVPDPCEECLKLEDLVEAVNEIASASVYEGGKLENGISVELVEAMLKAKQIADDSRH